MSDTPRTDDAAFPITQEEISGKVVDVEFARQLERELAYEKRETNGLQQEIDRLLQFISTKART